MKILILGACGTFMAGIALLARELGHEVIGIDAHVYPPMSTQLSDQGIQLIQGYDNISEVEKPDIVIIGNAMSRGNPAVEHVLNKGWRYISGPQWLHENVLFDRWVLAVSGTHGKTTTSSMLAWILESAGCHPGYLIGGLPQNFSTSARLGQSPFFVVEADEYDSVFYDKRSKFMHYHPKTLLINNLEFDHADIFNSLEDILKQFQFLLRTVPNQGAVIVNGDDENIQEVLKRGCWSEVMTFSQLPSNSHFREAGNTDGITHFHIEPINSDYSAFNVFHQNENLGSVRWSLIGRHNALNGLAAIVAAKHAGVSPEASIKALSLFKNTKRRLEKLSEINGIGVYDDFAHHPTAIATTLDGLRQHVDKARIIAVIELGSNTMRAGVHVNDLMQSVDQADEVVFLRPNNCSWDFDGMIQSAERPVHSFENVDKIIGFLSEMTQVGDQIVIMSNKSFDGIHQKLIKVLDK
ncbi:MAG: UDP-N-acetylmuramate:L-alanyl-gamma-D-glutamyl-meso-diaminopimelate ligase [Gammaproteobacteria bacterium]